MVFFFFFNLVSQPFLLTKEKNFFKKFKWKEVFNELIDLFLTFCIRCSPLRERRYLHFPPPRI